MINIPVPLTTDRNLYQFLSEVIRRAKDETAGTTANSLVLPVGDTGNYARVTLDNDYALVVTPLTGTGINSLINIGVLVLPVGTTGSFARVELDNDYALKVTPI